MGAEVMPDRIANCGPACGGPGRNSLIDRKVLDPRVASVLPRLGRYLRTPPVAEHSHSLTVNFLLPDYGRRNTGTFGSSFAGGRLRNCVHVAANNGRTSLKLLMIRLELSQILYTSVG